MITYEFFIENFKKTVDLMGWKISESRARLIHESIMNFSKQDFVAALPELKNMEMFNYYRFEQTIRRVRGERIEKEAEEQAKKDEREFLAWWRTLKDSRQTCRGDYVCYECSIQYCDIIAKAACRGIQEIMAGQKTEEQVNVELSRFRGMGWENRIEEAQAF